MRLRSSCAFLAMLVLGLTAVPAAAQPTCGLWNGNELHLAGRIAEADVTVYLDTGWPSREEENGASGLMLDARKWLDEQDGGDDGLVALDGRFFPDCRLELHELIGEATWSLRLVSRDRVTGKRIANGREERLDFRVTAPFDCTAGPWKRFDAAGWPVTFEFPASARDSGEGFACPDVSRLAWDAGPTAVNRVAVEVSPLENGGTRTRVGPFVSLTPGRWMVDDRDGCFDPGEDRDDEPTDDEPSVPCGSATVSSWHGFTVVQGASTGEDRGYRPGGGFYIGQGSGVVYYAFLLGNEAILVTSDDLPKDIADLDSPPLPDARSTGLMAARIVRSLKRR